MVAILDTGIQSPLKSLFNWCLVWMLGADTANSMDTSWAGEVRDLVVVLSRSHSAILLFNAYVIPIQ